MMRALGMPFRDSRRGWWGLRRRPGRLALVVLRMPVTIYRNHPDRLPADTFLRLVHIGRRTGRPHEAVLMLMRYDHEASEAVVCAAWGPDSDWVRNLRAGPAVIAQVGTRTFTPEHRFLTPRESYEIAVAFRREHPARLRLFSALLGWGNLWDDAALQSFVTTHPLIALRPAPTKRADNPIG